MTTGLTAHDAAQRQTAGAHMVRHIPRAVADTPVSTVIQSCRGQRFDSADTIFVTDKHGRLQGIVRINDLFTDGERPISQIMEPEHEAVRYGDDQEEIAVLAIKLNMVAVPVIDDDGRLIGAVPPEALFKILRDEHMEDLQRLAGIQPHEEGPVVALDAPLIDRFRRRLPWLLLGLLVSSITTLVMTGFEETIAENVAVAFFVPALVYITGSVGSQAVSVAVRGLATDEIALSGLIPEEFIIGIAIGTSLGLVSFVAVYAVFGDVILSLAVGLAVLGGSAVSAMVGFGLPWIFQRLGSDPALGSGPICTVVQDVASLSLYFVLISTLII
jgi:magnesium transporter